MKIGSRLHQNCDQLSNGVPLVQKGGPECLGCHCIEANWLRVFLLAIVAISGASVLASTCFAEIKEVAYPEIKVTLNEAYQPDAAFEKMRAAFADAVAKKDVNALTTLVAPTFLWTIDSQMADELDLGRDAIHNFKVVFGFRAAGSDTDGGVEDGPYWDALAAFANDPTYYRATDSGNLVCGPIGAEIADQATFEQADKKLSTEDEAAEWYFTLASTDVAKSPTETGTPTTKIGAIALPVLGSYPEPHEGQPAPQPTQLQVLLPSGQTGWILAAAARPLFSARLCYAKTPSGDWKIAAVDEPSQ
jgi:hypothetical protein